MLVVLLGAFSAVHRQLWFSWFRILCLGPHQWARAGLCPHLYVEGAVPPLLPRPAGAEKEGEEAPWLTPPNPSSHGPLHPNPQPLCEGVPDSRPLFQAHT